MSAVADLFAAKIDRAGELLSTIHAELAAYYESGPYTHRQELLDDPPRFVLYVDSIDPPPLRLGVLMGEFIHDLRSVLDHLVWQLALTRTETPSPRLQFPIYVERPVDWRSIAGDRLKDVPPEAVEAIERLQPYHSTNPREQALAVVHALSNEDKHQVILETAAVNAEPDASMFELVANDDVAEDAELEISWGSRVRPGVKVLTAHFVATGPRPAFRLTGTLPVEIGFGSSGLRAAAMPGLAGEITRHVRSFERFFD